MNVIAEKKEKRVATQIVSDGDKYLLVYRHDVPFHDRDRMIPIAAEQVETLIADRGLVKM